MMTLSERERSRWSCGRKVCHLTYAAARAEADRLEAKDGELMRAYWCRWCANLHIGHAIGRAAVIELLVYAYQEFAAERHEGSAGLARREG